MGAELGFYLRERRPRLDFRESRGFRARPLQEAFDVMNPRIGVGRKPTFGGRRPHGDELDR